MTTRAKRSAKPTHIAALLRSDRELLKRLVREALQEILEAEMTETVGAQPGERTGDLIGYRAGYYTRGVVTRIGKPELRVPGPRVCCIVNCFSVDVDCGTVAPGPGRAVDGEPPHATGSGVVRRPTRGTAALAAPE